MRKYNILIVVAIAVIILDQMTKVVITRYLSLYQSIEVIGGFFNIVHVRNPGAAFSLLHDSGKIFRTLFLTGTSVIALVVIFFVYRKAGNELIYRISLSLIAGGAVGNLIDRIRFGEVIDFLDFYMGRYHWPAFNVADSAITIGVFLAVLYLYRGRDD